MDFDVLVIGSDINAYYMARCCYEAYHKKAIVLAKEKLAFTHYSTILNIIYDQNIWQEKNFIKRLNLIAKECTSSKILVVSSNETYAELLVKNKNLIDPKYVFSYPSLNIISSLINKKEFYEKYQKMLDLPTTLSCQVKNLLTTANNLKFPLIIKPADVISYNHLDFEGKCKIYKIKNKQELEETYEILKNSGYQSDLIVQEYIPGDDSYLFDSVVYVDKKGKVKLISFAQIGLQEHSQNLVGNAAVLINGFNTYKGDVLKAVKKAKRFFEKIGYQGFAEIDWKYDKRDNKFKILEINARQGRCSYYISALNYNLIKVLVDDLIYDKPMTYKFLDEKVLLSFVPKTIIKKYVVNKKFQKEALKLWKVKGAINPVKCKLDKHPWRLYLYWKKYFGYLKSYKNSYWINK